LTFARSSLMDVITCWNFVRMTMYINYFYRRPPLIFYIMWWLLLLLLLWTWSVIRWTFTEIGELLWPGSSLRIVDFDDTIIDDDMYLLGRVQSACYVTYVCSSNYPWPSVILGPVLSLARCYPWPGVILGPVLSLAQWLCIEIFFFCLDYPLCAVQVKDFIVLVNHFMCF